MESKDIGKDFNTGAEASSKSLKVKIFLIIDDHDLTLDLIFLHHVK